MNFTINDVGYECILEDEKVVLLVPDMFDEAFNYKFITKVFILTKANDIVINYDYENKEFKLVIDSPKLKKTYLQTVEERSN